MKSVLSNQYFLLFSRVCVGLIFIMASIEKIAVAELFAVNIEAYDILPLPVINIVALIIPWLELLCGIFLVSGFYLRPSSFIVSVLLVSFIFLLISAMIRGLRIDCGCFGVGGNSEVSWYRIVEDILLLLLSIHIYSYSEIKITISEEVQSA